MQEDNLKKQNNQYIIADDFYILDITSELDNIYNEKYTDKSIFEIRENADFYKKGDLLKINDDNLLFLKGKFEQYVEREERLISPKMEIDLKQYFSNIDIEKVNELKSKIEEIRKDKDVYYRILHHSFKMYQARKYVFQLTKLLIEVLAQKPYELTTKKDLVDKMQEISLHFVLRGLIKKVLDINFNMNRNYHKNWVEDASVLFSTLNILMESCEFIVIFNEEFFEKKSYIHLKEFFITSEQAGAMAVWGGFKNMRYLSQEEKEKIIT